MYAALLSPRASDGELDTASFRQQVIELSRFDLRGYAINGATGEFTIVSDADVDRLVRVARQEAPEAEILCRIGAGAGDTGTGCCACGSARGGAAVAVAPVCMIGPK